MWMPSHRPPASFMISKGVMASVSSALSTHAAVADDAHAEPIDEAAFQILYRRTVPGLRSYIRKICGDIDLADDIFQETFYRFLRARPPALDDRQMKAYLYKTATSVLTDHWRRANRERLWRFEWLASKQVQRHPEECDGFRAVFRLLRPRQRALLWLAYVEGFSHNEIAGALSLSEKSVRVLLFRARKKLAGMLTTEGLYEELKS